MSYQGAQIFEIIGLNKLVVNTCFIVEQFQN